MGSMWAPNVSYGYYVSSKGILPGILLQACCFWPSELIVNFLFPFTDGHREAERRHPEVCHRPGQDGQDGEGGSPLLSVGPNRLHFLHKDFYVTKVTSLKRSFPIDFKSFPILMRTFHFFNKLFLAAWGNSILLMPRGTFWSLALGLNQRCLWIELPAGNSSAWRTWKLAGNLIRGQYQIVRTSGTIN